MKGVRDLWERKGRLERIKLEKNDPLEAGQRKVKKGGDCTRRKRGGVGLQG